MDWSRGLKASIVVLCVGGLAFVLRPAPGPQPTPPPTDAELQAFMALVPATFRPEIARAERNLQRKSRRSPSAVPTAIGIEDGLPATIVGPKAPGLAPSGALYGQLSYNGSYLPPRVPVGNLTDTVWYRSPTALKEVRLVLSRRSSLPRHTFTMGWDGMAASKNSSARDLGPLPLVNGRYLYSAPGTRGDGFSVAPNKGAPPRLLALAPQELPPQTTPEPQGYALLFDQVVVGRRMEKRGELQMRFVSGQGLAIYLPAFARGLFTRATMVAAQIHDFRLMALAHVYVRDGARWRYARSWALEGGASAYSAADDALFRQAHAQVGTPNPTLGGSTSRRVPPALGVPTELKPYRVDLIKP